jgi:hypothetical protein
MRSFDPSAILTIRVGKEPNHKDFIAHESFLTTHSEFFRRAMNGNWMEAETRIVKLPEDDAEVFAGYLNYIYTNQFTAMEKSNEELISLKSMEFKTHVSRQYQRLFCVYILADKLQDVVTKNAAITAIVGLKDLTNADGGWAIPSPGTINHVYKETTERSPARRLVASLYSRLPFITILKNTANMHEDFLDDLAESLNIARPITKGPIGRSRLAGVVGDYLEKE